MHALLRRLTISSFPKEYRICFTPTVYVPLVDLSHSLVAVPFVLFTIVEVPCFFFCVSFVLCFVALRCVLLVRKTGFSLISYPCLLSTVPLVPTRKRMGVSGIRSVLVFVHAVRQSHLCCAGCLSFVSASFLCGGAPPPPPS